MQVHPEWETEKLFIFEQQQQALLEDSVSGSQALNDKVESLDDIEEKFKPLTYSKGKFLRKHNFIVFTY